MKFWKIKLNLKGKIQYEVGVQSCDFINITDGVVQKGSPIIMIIKLVLR